MLTLVVPPFPGAIPYSWLTMFSHSFTRTVPWSFLTVFFTLCQVQQLQSKCSLLEQQLETEQQKAESLVALMDSERKQQVALQEQEQAVSKQLQQDLNQAKVGCGTFPTTILCCT